MGESKMRAPLLILAATTTLAACQTYPNLAQRISPAANAGREQQLLEAERRLAAAANERGLVGALAGAIDPTDGFVVRPGATLQVTDLENGIGGASSGPIFWQPDKVFLSAANDMGMTSGRYVQVEPGSQAVQGRYVVVWRKNATGEWRALSETRTPDPAIGEPTRLSRQY
jgi:hypothetical protein